MELSLSAEKWSQRGAEAAWARPKALQRRQAGAPWLPGAVLHKEASLAFLAPPRRQQK